MLKIDFEFRKGIFFLRLIGDMNKKTYQAKEKELQSLINDNQFKYIVINVNNLKTIDIDGLNYLNKISDLLKQNEINLIVCDRFNLLKTLMNNEITSIKTELEVL